MSTDDKRMHGGNTPGLVGGRGHERHEEPVRLDAAPEPGEERPPLDGPAEDLVRGRTEMGRQQERAPGGDDATTPDPDAGEGAAS